MDCLVAQARRNDLHVIAGHSRSKNGVASLAYDPAIHHSQKNSYWMDARVKPGHDKGMWCRHGIRNLGLRGGRMFAVIPDGDTRRTGGRMSVNTRIYAGGAITFGGQPAIDDLLAASYSAVLVWSVHVDATTACCQAAAAAPKKRRSPPRRLIAKPSRTG
jgi:hypothetical protein